MDFVIAAKRLSQEFGEPVRDVKKVKAWELGGVGVVLQIDSPNRESAAYIWLPYPADGSIVPEIALEYPEEATRHSGTYASQGLEKGKPALKLFVRSNSELERTLTYIQAMAGNKTLPPVEADTVVPDPIIPVDGSSTNNNPERPSARREAIPRAVQHDIWRRDEGRCVECASKERLCFDHIIPFSRGGSNTARNLQLLCERCNLSKGNRI